MIEGPVPEITTDAEPPVNEPFTITITFSVPVTEFDVDDSWSRTGPPPNSSGSGDTHGPVVEQDGGGGRRIAHRRRVQGPDRGLTRGVLGVKVRPLVQQRRQHPGGRLGRRHVQGRSRGRPPARRCPLRGRAAPALPRPAFFRSSTCKGVAPSLARAHVSAPRPSSTAADDETFTVALGNLPSEVTAGSPSSVEATITDDDSGPHGDHPDGDAVGLAEPGQ